MNFTYNFKSHKYFRITDGLENGYKGKPDDIYILPGDYALVISLGELFIGIISIISLFLKYFLYNNDIWYYIISRNYFSKRMIVMKEIFTIGHSTHTIEYFYIC